MTDQQHTITPSPKLVLQWYGECHKIHEPVLVHIANQAAQWGADQELEACCVLMDDWGLDGKDLIECRRPKPPSLKEQALEKLMNLEQGTNPPGFNDYNTIRRALEALPE
jgi:hypothetical protein